MFSVKEVIVGDAVGKSWMFLNIFLDFHVFSSSSMDRLLCSFVVLESAMKNVGMDGLLIVSNWFFNDKRCYSDVFCSY